MTYSKRLALTAKAWFVIYIIVVVFTYGHAAVSFRAQYPNGEYDDNRAEVQALPVALFFAPLYWSIRLNELIAQKGAAP